VSEYFLDHHQEGERRRLALMSRLLDAMHRRHIERLGVRPGARTLEVGCGNGSMSAWLAARVAPGGRAGGGGGRPGGGFIPAQRRISPVRPAPSGLPRCPRHGYGFTIGQLTDVSACNLQQHLSCNRTIQRQ
jgi:hypothetical protein